MTQTKAELLQTRHQGDIRLGDADSTHYVGFKAPATVGTSLVWTLPAADGTAGYYLKTDGSGNLGWSLDNSGVSLSGSTNNTVATVTGANALQGEANLTYDGNTLALSGNDNQAITIGASADLTLKADGSNSAIAHNGDGDLIIKTDGTGEDVIVQAKDLLVFRTDGNNERMRIDSSGRLLLGITAARTAIGATGAPGLQVEGLGASDSQISIVRNSNTAAGPYFAMVKTRGTSDGAITIVQNDDTLGTLYFTAADGVDINQQSAFVRCQVDGTPGANDTPGRLIFSTTADGDITPTERLRISSTGVSKFTGGISQVATAAGALDLNLRTSNYFTKTISGNSTFTFSNPAASGTVTAFTLELTHSSGTVTWPSEVKWNADTAPTLTTGKTHLFMFVTDDGGSRYRGSALVDYVN